MLWSELCLLLCVLIVTCRFAEGAGHALSGIRRTNFGANEPYELGENIDNAKFDSWYNEETQNLKAYLDEKKGLEGGIRICLLKRQNRMPRLMAVERDFYRAAHNLGVHIEVFKVRTASFHPPHTTAR
eukprot:9008005-Pyramimonas_sp.AAC.1